MCWNIEDKEPQKKINTNKHRVAKLLTCFDREGPSPTSFKFGDKILESTPEKYDAILGMKSVGGRKGYNIINHKGKEIDDNVLYDKYFSNIKNKGKVGKTIMHVSPDMIHEHLFDKILNTEIVENVKGCVLYLSILFVEHTKKGTIPKVQNKETDFPRVRRWDVYEISDFIHKTDMS
ncbi:hypothetical protein MKX01_003702 [Papaver californicum]|nr:hypothetical protein MKX01_003702 [Papaver californicum]